MENLNKANLLRLNPDSNSKESARLGSAVSETNLKIERDLMKNKNLNEAREVFVKTVMEIFESPTSFVNAISEWGLFGEEGADPTDARKVWYPRYKKEFFAYIHAIEGDEKVRLPPTPK